MRRAQATARTTGQNVTRSFDQMRIRTTQAFGSMRLAASGFGIAMGGLAFGSFARQALDFATSMSETARSIGVTVEQYQILRRAAIENGASMEGMERSIAILNRTLGQARAGVPAAVQAFRALRIDPEQFTKAGDVIPRVMQAISGLRTESEQAAAAQRLMGRGAAEMIPFLVQGAEGYNRVARAAEEAGLMTQEQADRADEARDKIELLSYALQTRLAIALADNIPVIESLISGFERLISIAATALDFLGQVRSGLAWAQDQGGIGLSYIVQGATGVNLEGDRQQRRARMAAANPRGYTQADNARLWSNWRSGPGARPRPATTGGNDLDLSPSGGGRSRGSRDRSAEQAIRRRHEVETELNRARIEELRAQQALATNAADRNEYAVMISYLEQGQTEAERTLSVLLKDRTQAEADTLADIELRRFHLERQAMDEQEAERVRSEQHDVEAGALEMQRDLLSAAADLADTAAERRESQLRLLDYAKQMERLELEGVIASRDATDAQKQIAQARLDMLDNLYLYREQGVLNSTRGPLADFMAELPTTAARANEALENVAANGLGSLTDGLTDAIMMTRSLGDVFKNVAKQIIADLLRIQIQRSIIGPLSNALSGILSGIGGGGGGFAMLPSGTGGWSGGTGAFGGFRAAGGPVIPGRSYVVGENGPELFRPGIGGNIIPHDGAGGGQEVNFYNTYKFEGVAITQHEFVQGLQAVQMDTMERLRQKGRRAA